MNKKLGMVLNKLEKIESRLELLRKIWQKILRKYEKLMQNTVTLTKFEALEERIEQLEGTL